MEKSDSNKRKSIPFEDIGIWMDWMEGNYETALKDYPEMMELVKESILENPLALSVHISRIPENFPKWKDDIEIGLKTTRIKKTKLHLELIQGLLYKFEFPDNLITVAVEKIRPELLEMEAYFKRILEEPSNTTRKKTSYHWQNKPEVELPVLYKLMTKTYQLIALETTYDQFKAIFTGQPRESIKPIKWIKAKNLNAYFIHQLIKKKRISKAVNNDIWETAKQCFVDGVYFSQLIDQYSNSKTGKPQNHKLIDDLLNTL